MFLNELNMCMWDNKQKKYNFRAAIFQGLEPKKKKKVRKLFTYYLKIAIINITIYRESLKQMIFI